MTVTDDGCEELDCRMNKKNALVYFQIVVLFHDILKHNRILIKETRQTMIRIIVLCYRVIFTNVMR